MNRNFSRNSTSIPEFIIASWKGAFVSINLVYREPCFTLLYKLGDGHTYKQTYKLIYIKLRIMTRQVELIMISDTSDSCTIKVPWQYHDRTMTVNDRPSQSLPEVLVTIELRPRCQELKRFTIYVTNFFCYCYSCMVIFRHKK